MDQASEVRQAVSSTVEPEGSEERKELRKTYAEERAFREQFGGEDRAEAIVERVNQRISGGVKPTRIRAECEGNITVQQLEDILACRHPDRGRPFGHWWDTVETIKHLIALEKWMDEEDAAGAGVSNYAETAVFNQVYGVLGMAHHARSLVAITGMYGIGKTFAARRYAQDNARGPVAAGAVMFEFSPGTKGDSGVLDAILGALEPHSPVKGAINAKLDRILNALRPGDFLIADECGIPAERGTGLRFMSYINEQAGVPVAMIGNPAFHTAVWGKRSDYDALASRTRHVSLGGNGSEDVDAFIAWKGLSGRRWKDAVLTIARAPGRNGGIRGVNLLMDEIRLIGAEMTPESLLGLAKSYGRVSE